MLAAYFYAVEFLRGKEFKTSRENILKHPVSCINAAAMIIYAVPRRKDFGRPMENVLKHLISRISAAAMTFYAAKFSRGKILKKPVEKNLAALPTPAILRLFGYEEIISKALTCTDAEITAIAF